MTKGQKITLGVFAIVAGVIFLAANPPGGGLNVNTALGIFISPGGLSLLIITYVCFRAYRKPKADDAYDCYEVANRLKRKGQIKEALAAYDDIASRFSDTDIGNDAKISADELRKRVGEQLPVGKGGGEDKDASKPDKKEDRFKDTRKYDEKGNKL